MRRSLMMGTPNADPRSYILPDTESRKIFERWIIPAEIGHLQSPDVSDGNSGKKRRPLAIFVVGQTGAGKTRTAPAIKQVMQSRRGPLAHFIADTFKTYHPSYAQLVAEKPALASPATGTDARRWLTMAAAHAIARRVDVLLESACRNPADFADLVLAFREGGYRVEVALLAVPAALSRLGILVRFYERLPEAGSGKLPIRLTPKAVHDDSYEGLIDAANFADESTAVDQIVVVRRGNLVTYANERAADGCWRHRAAAADAIGWERGRRLPLSEEELAQEDLKKLRARDAPGLSTQLAEIEALLEPILAHDVESEHVSVLRPWLLPDLEETAEMENLDKVDLRLGLDIF